MSIAATRSRVPKKVTIAFIAVAVFLLLCAVLVSMRGVVTEAKRMEIVQVVDGQTVILDDHGNQREVKLAGLATAPRNPQNLNLGPNMCLGEQSYVWLKDRLVQGATAVVDIQQEGDQTYAVIRLAGLDVNVSMAEDGMAAPTGVGVGEAKARQIAEGNALAQRRGLGLYSKEEACTLNSHLHEAQWGMDTIDDDTPDVISAIDEKSVELARAVDQVRIVQDDINALDPNDAGSFANLAWGPNKQALVAEADEIATEGMDRLRALNERRNALATG